MSQSPSFDFQGKVVDGPVAQTKLWTGDIGRIEKAGVSYWIHKLGPELETRHSYRGQSHGMMTFQLL